jgi:pimeloyl-ACP methyl ester carboxylesterase
VAAASPIGATPLEYGCSTQLSAPANRIKCPTLIVASEDNPITPVAEIDEIAAVRLERFANAGRGV